MIEITDTQTMALFRTDHHQRRAVRIGGKQTTIALEPEFWSAADRQAQGQGVTWRDWIKSVLGEKPDGYGRASWIRIAILQNTVRV